MPVKIEFETTNAAFADGGMSEVARRLRMIADRCEGSGTLVDVLSQLTKSPIFDANGNRIGSWSATIDAEQEE
jgi:hypothetical protein